MTENNAAESVTVTDEQVNEFFSNEGKFSEKQPEDAEKPVKEETSEDSSKPEVEKKEEPKEEKKVNYGALHEERMRRKEAVERAKALEAERDELIRRLQQNQPKQPEVSYDDDPMEVMRRETLQMKQVLLAQANAAKQQNEEAKYWERVAQSEAAFKQDKPDFDAAVEFLAKSRIEELKDLGWGDEDAKKVLRDEIKWISDKAYADEVNPAERFYNLALRRGYAAKQPEAPATSAIEEKLDRIEKGMKTNRALPPASKSVKMDLTPEALADMNVDALTNLHGQTDFDKAWQKLFGG